MFRVPKRRISLLMSSFASKTERRYLPFRPVVGFKIQDLGFQAQCSVLRTLDLQFRV